MSQFVLYRSPTTDERLKRAVKEFVTGIMAFLAARNSKQSLLPAPKRILQRPEGRQEPEKIERKVDVLAEQLAELSLLMKTNQTTEQIDNVRKCSFRKDPDMEPPVLVLIRTRTLVARFLESLFMRRIRAVRRSAR